MRRATTQKGKLFTRRRGGVAVAAGGTTSLRPNATANDGSGDGVAWSLSGAATPHLALADDSENTVVNGFQDSEGGGTTGTLKLDLDTASFAGKTITSVTPWVRQSSVTTGNVEIILGSGGLNFAADSLPNPGGAAITSNGTARLTKPAGGAWDQPAIDALTLWIVFNTGGSDGACTVIEAGVTVAWT